MNSKPARIRPGFALTLGVVCISVLVLFAGALLSMATREMRFVEHEAMRVQTQWLAESGVAKAAARLRADPSYRGETWDIDSSELNGHDSARVQIQIEPDARMPDRLRVSVHAEYPFGRSTKIQATKTIMFDRKTLQPEPKP